MGYNRKSLAALALTGVLLLLSSCGGNDKLTSLVNPLVGTDGHGHTFPGAIVPFGMVQPGPDTRLEGWDGCSGYHYSDDTIYGFSHTHLSGTGCEDLCDILLMPVSKDFAYEGNCLKNTDYCSRFSHSNEVATPGYYSVRLDRNSTKVELSCDERKAVHRYSFAQPDGNGFIIDLQHRDKLLSGHIELRDGKIVGSRESAAWNPDQHLFFAIASEVPFAEVKFLNDSTQAYVSFPEGTSSATLWVAISAVDIDGALGNLNALPLNAFDAMRTAADSTWEQALAKIKTEGGTKEQRRTFYTSLYHCFTSPYLFSDIDGRYRGQDGEIHKVDSNRQLYTVFSLWDTYRALHPLLTIIEPERTEDFICSFLKHYEQGGELTMWELAAHETHCMIGYHAAPVILEALNAGLLDNWADTVKAKLLEGMMVTANLPAYGRAAYGQQGFLSSEVDNESASKTLEYAYDDWCIAQYAQSIGSVEDDAMLLGKIYDEYIRRSQSWRNVLDPNGFMHARRNGGFVTPFNPTEINNHYTEGNSWQYSTYVPQDIYGWIEAQGGAEMAERFLDSLFYGSSELSGRDQVDVTGLIGQYAHGNEPSHHAAFLYTYLNRPEKTQQVVDRIIREFYSSRPDGLCGNEDCGQMSAWYVMSAMGFYPVCPGSGEYVTVKPLFKKVDICNGKIVIESKKWQPGKFWRNGQFFDKSAVTLPPHDLATPAPLFNSWESRFDSVAKVTIYSSNGSEVFYTLDGSVPDTSSLHYSSPIAVDRDVVITARAYNPTTGYSFPVVHALTRFSADKKLSYVIKPDPQYYENGEEGLVDRLHGLQNYRVGGWQGWAGDMEVVVDLLKVKPIHKVSVSCLEDTRSWIFFPKAMEVSFSDDGNSFSKPVVTPTNYVPIADPAGNKSLRSFDAKVSAAARYVKVKVQNFGKMPSWHLSAGEQAWLFIDEVEVE